MIMWSIFQNFNNGTQSGNIELSQAQVLLFLHEIEKIEPFYTAHPVFESMYAR